MKRANIGSALLAAPLIISGSLFAGSALADQAQTVPLQLDSECIVSSTSTGYFALQNKNDFAVTAHYDNTDNGAMGDISVPGNSFYLYPVSIDLNNHNNQTVFTADGWTSPNSTNAHMDVQCRDDQIARFAPAAAPAPVDNTGGATTAPVDTTSTDSGVVGGKGGDDTTVAATTTPATTNTAATLADTGASQMLPYTAAALIAVAVLGTTMAVRKNVL